jgi:hypothetical protein
VAMAFFTGDEVSREAGEVDLEVRGLVSGAVDLEVWGWIVVTAPFPFF